MEILKRTLCVIIATAAGVFVSFQVQEYTGDYEVGYLAMLFTAVIIWQLNCLHFSTHKNKENKG